MKKPSYPTLLLILVTAGTFMASLDASIVNVSLPAMMLTYHVRLDEIEWVVTAYMIAFAALMPLSAWLREKIGSKKLYIISLTIFTLASALCGLAASFETLICARILQALGAGAITPTAMSMIAEAIPPERRGRALGWWGMGVVFGPAIGPSLGGYLTTRFGWPWIFLVNIPIGFVAIAASAKIIRENKSTIIKNKHFNIVSFLSLLIFIVGFLYGMSKGEHLGWASPKVLGSIGISLVGLIVFVMDARSSHNPILDLDLLKVPTFSSAIIITALRSIALFGSTFLIPFYLQGPHGFSETVSGAIMFPGALAIAITMPIAGRLTDKMDDRIVAITGLLLTSAFMLSFAFVDATTPIIWIVIPMIVRGIGIGLLVNPVIASAINSVPNAKAGMASSAINIVQQMAGSFGIVVFASIFDASVSSGIRVASATGLSLPPIDQVMHAILNHAHDPGTWDLKMVTPQDLQAIVLSAMSFVFLLGAGLIALGVIPAMKLINPNNRRAKIRHGASVIHSE